jgi:RNA polymerase sigma factor (sigma-70 family)
MELKTKVRVGPPRASFGLNGMEDSKDNHRPIARQESTSELLKCRDQESIEELLRRYRPLLRAIVVGEIEPTLRSKVDASDLVQEACLEVAKSIDQIQSTKSPQFFSFLRQIVIHKLSDVRRRFLLSHKRNARRESSVTQHRLENLEKVHQDNPNVLEQLINEELLNRTRVVMATLPLEVKKMLDMRFVRGMTYLEIGQKLNRSEDDVRMFIKRWLMRIKDEIRPGSSS